MEHINDQINLVRRRDPYGNGEIPSVYLSYIIENGKPIALRLTKEIPETPPDGVSS